MGVKTPYTKPAPEQGNHRQSEHDKAIIKEFKEAMDKGDERAALRAEAKYRRIDVRPEKNIYDYGPNDPDPTVDYYFEPLNPEEQAKFDKEDRREHGLTDDEPATNGSANPTHTEWRNRFACANKASRRAPQHPHPPQPTRRQAPKANHPQPLTCPLLCLLCILWLFPSPDG